MNDKIEELEERIKKLEERVEKLERKPPTIMRCSPNPILKAVGKPINTDEVFVPEVDW